MSEPTRTIPDKCDFQDDIIKALQAEGKRSKDPHASMCLMHMVLTYFAVQCAVKTLPTRKMARDAMKREVNNAFDYLDITTMMEPKDEQKN